MNSQTWSLRARLFAQRFWQPTCACLTCMPGNLSNAWSLPHWTVALQTGLVTGVLVLLLSFTPAIRVFRHRVGNAAVVGVLTALSDAYAHPNHYGMAHFEAVVTGAVSFVLALVATYLLEDKARRVRQAWRRLFGNGPAEPT
jgi:hypothetical protein